MANADRSYWAPILRGEIDKVRELYEQGASVDGRMGKNDPTPLHYAIEEGQLEIGKFFIERVADLNDDRDQFQPTALSLAARKGRIQFVKALLDAGAALDRPDKNGWVALDHAACCEESTAGIAMAELVKKGADIHRVSKSWGPPLIKACLRGHLSAVKELLRHGADPNFASENGLPLMVAIDEKRADVAMHLRLAGADPNLRYTFEEDTPGNQSRRNKTPLEYAEALKQKKLIAVLEASREELEAMAAPAPMTEADVPKLWRRIEKWIRKSDPGLKKSLNKAAQAERLEKIAQSTGYALPADFVASAAIHDGQKGGAEESLIPEDWLDNPYELLPADAILAEWQSWKTLADSGEFRKQSSIPDDGVRSDWWNAGWIPVAGNGGGDFLCLDMAPTEHGRVGQVIELRHDAPARRLVARSFADFLRDLADRWESRMAD